MASVLRCSPLNRALGLSSSRLEFIFMIDKECYGTKKSINGVESTISCWEASDKYGVSIRHGKMNTNGELRFRLLSTDGSAYIKTVTTSESEGWQNPHYHNHLMETYIVEEGWVGYIECIKDEATAVKYNKGDVFTTKPGVAHNLFIPKETVVHTVKHSAYNDVHKKEPDWHSDSKACEILNSYEKKALASNFGNADSHNEPLIEKNATDELNKLTFDDSYTESYKHFDNLIWKVPSWSTAVFGIFIGGLLSLYSRQSDFHDLNVYVGGLTLFFSVFIATLSYTLFRFRCHQINTKIIHRRIVLSPQFFLQLLTNIEAIILLIISVVLLNNELVVFVSGFVLAILIIFTIHSEIHLSAINQQYSQSKTEGKKIITKQMGS